jgi:hypothetical protein
MFNIHRMSQRIKDLRVEGTYYLPININNRTAYLCFTSFHKTISSFSLKHLKCCIVSSLILFFVLLHTSYILEVLK